MWEVAGQVSSGISFNTCRENSVPLLACVLAENRRVVNAEGLGSSLDIWFRGSRSLGDFLACCCSSKPSFHKPIVRTVVPSKICVAIVPDYILAVQELLLAGENMDSESSYPSSQKTRLESIVTSAKD